MPSQQRIFIVSEDEQDLLKISALLPTHRYLVERISGFSQLNSKSVPGLPVYLIMLRDAQPYIQRLAPLSQTYPVLAVLDKSCDPSLEVELIRSGVQDAVQLRHLNRELLSLLIEKTIARFGSLAPKDQHEQMFKALCDSLTFQMAYRIISLPGEPARFIYVSDGVRHISGLSREDVLKDPQTLYNQIIEEDRARLLEAEELAVRTLTPLELEVRKIDTSGRMRWVHIRSFPRPNGDGGVIWDGVESDITGYKLAEAEVKRLLNVNQGLLQRERQARERSEQNNRMKDEFLASLSHELRTPINAVLGWTQLIQRKVLSEADHDKAIDTIERNARLQAQMIADLLDMSRIISGKVQLEFDLIDTHQFMLELIDTFRPSAESKHIALSLEIEPELNCQLSGERSRLQQIFANIISNALKFTPENGSVIVSVRQKEQQVEFSVTDSGVGIKPEFLPLVFDRFRQADASFSRKFGGLGLGLAIVKQLTELHAGSVSVSSEGEGKGSTFTIILPVRENVTGHSLKEKDLKVSGEIGRETLKDKRIFVIDDQPDALDLARQIFAEAGAAVITAHSGVEALEKLGAEQGSIDLIVSDIGMPEMDGMKFLMNLRASLPRYVHVPTIALTAFARSEDRNRVLSAGYQIHMTKPVNASELVATADSLIQHASDRQSVANCAG